MSHPDLSSRTAYQEAYDGQDQNEAFGRADLAERRPDAAFHHALNCGGRLGDLVPPADPAKAARLLVLMDRLVADMPPMPDISTPNWRIESVAGPRAVSELNPGINNHKENSMKIGEHVRQGDTLLRKVSGIPENAQEMKRDNHGRIVLAHGERTGHAHAFRNKGICSFSVTDEITERPVSLQRDDRGRLHSENGAALKYPDGWGIHAVHGVRMPGELVEDHSKITVARIDAEQNAEVRRVLIGWYGADRYMRDCGARIIHQDVDALGNERRLLHRDLKDDESLVMVEVTDSTPQEDGHHKKYMLRVDPKAYGGRAGRECHAAIASTWRHKADNKSLFFSTPESYRPTVET